MRKMGDSVFDKLRHDLSRALRFHTNRTAPRSVMQQNPIGSRNDR